MLVEETIDNENHVYIDDNHTMIDMFPLYMDVSMNLIWIDDSNQIAYNDNIVVHSFSI